MVWVTSSQGSAWLRDYSECCYSTVVMQCGSLHVLMLLSKRSSTAWLHGACELKQHRRCCTAVYCSAPRSSVLQWINSCASAIDTRSKCTSSEAGKWLGRNSEVLRRHLEIQMCSLLRVWLLFLHKLCASFHSKNEHSLAFSTSNTGHSIWGHHIACNFCFYPINPDK